MRYTSTWQRVRRMTLVLLSLCTSLCIGLGACAPFTTTTPANCQNSPCPPPVYWQADLTQTFASGPAGAFALKWMEVTLRQFRFYYVFKPANPLSGLQVTANSSLPSQSSATTSLAATNQTLGQIRAYTVGVIHVARRSQAGQLITLQISPIAASGVTDTTWRLAPLRQIMDEPSPSKARFNLATDASGHSNGLPEAIWSGVDGVQQVSYLKVVMPGQPVSQRSYIFVRSDDPVTVNVITESEYLAVAGPANFTP